MADLRERGTMLQERLFKLSLMDREIREPSAMTSEGVSYGSGYPITGLEKFLGYFDGVLNIANFPSISVTTDFSMAMSACAYSEKPGKDRVIFDGRSEGSFQKKASRALEIFKSRYGIPGSFSFYIERTRRYGDAKGLGESAAVASAAARSLVAASFGEEGMKNGPLISRLARLVSGSGTRSSAGGLSMWLSFPYVREDYCYGFPLKFDKNELNIACIPMKSSWITDSAHRLAVSSRFYGQWAVEKFDEINEEVERSFDLDYILSRSVRDMYNLNSVILSTGNFIHTPDSLKLIYRLKEFTEKNEGLYYTSDTGPSIVLLSRTKSLITEFLEQSETENFLFGSPTKEPPKCSEKFMKDSKEALFQ